MKIFIGLTAWAPLHYPSKAEIFKKTILSLEKARQHPSAPETELLIIDNDCQNPLMQKELKNVQQLKKTQICRFSPQLGWAKSRNFVIQKWIENSTAERLILMDQDVEILDPTWLAQIGELHRQEPELHAYHIIFTKQFWAGSSFLKNSQKRAEFADRFLGGVNILSREVPQRIGGYNSDISMAAGTFADEEFGWRLRFSGLLSGYAGLYLDPFKSDILHNNSEDNAENADVFKEEAFQIGIDRHLHRYQEVQTGQNLFFDYRIKETEF